METDITTAATTTTTPLLTATMPSKTQALLCFHGTGSKGSIFHVQLARICFLLGSKFEFIFVDGPLECAAGPGVLPVFANQEPYYSWFAGSGTSIEESMVKICGAVDKSIATWKADRRLAAKKEEEGGQKGEEEEEEVEIVGGIGFSEGALALALLLWMQQQQKQEQNQQISPPSDLPPLRFAVMSCCFFPDEASKWLTSMAAASGQAKAEIQVPTLHIHGNRDFCLGRARRLVRNHYPPGKAHVIKTEAGHHLPTRKEEVGEVVERIVEMAAGAAVGVAAA